MIELRKLADKHLKHAIDAFLGAYVMHTLENNVNPESSDNSHSIELMDEKAQQLHELLKLMRITTFYRQDLDCECHPIQDNVWCVYCDIESRLREWIEEYGEKPKE